VKGLRPEACTIVACADRGARA